MTQELFGGRSWQDDPELLPAMLDAFRVMTTLQKFRFLLDQASRLPLLDAERQRLEELRASLEPPEGWSKMTLAELEIGPRLDEVATFLRSLAGTARRALKLAQL